MYTHFRRSSRFVRPRLIEFSNSVRVVSAVFSFLLVFSLHLQGFDHGVVVLWLRGIHSSRNFKSSAPCSPPSTTYLYLSEDRTAPFALSVEACHTPGAAEGPITTTGTPAYPKPWCTSCRQQRCGRSVPSADKTEHVKPQSQ